MIVCERSKRSEIERGNIPSCSLSGLDRSRTKRENEKDEDKLHLEVRKRMGRQPPKGGSARSDCTKKGSRSDTFGLGNEKGRKRWFIKERGKREMPMKGQDNGPKKSEDKKEQRTFYVLG